VVFLSGFRPKFYTISHLPQVFHMALPFNFAKWHLLRRKVAIPQSTICSEITFHICQYVRKLSKYLHIVKTFIHWNAGGAQLQCTLKCRGE
jgi:hypothetical protein